MICEKCSENKDLSEFWPDKRQRTSFRKWCFACDIKPKKEHKIKNLDRVRSIEDIKQSLLYQARQRAKQTGLTFNLKVADITIPAICPLLGIPLAPSKGTYSDGSPSLDRIDSSRGYTSDNVWVISHRANRIKYNATPEELELLAANLRIKVNG